MWIVLRAGSVFAPTPQAPRPRGLISYRCQVFSWHLRFGRVYRGDTGIQRSRYRSGFLVNKEINQMSIEQLSLYAAEAVLIGVLAVGVIGYVIAVVIDTVRINRRLRGGEG